MTDETKTTLPETKTTPAASLPADITLTNDNQKKLSLRQRCRTAFQNVAKREWTGVVKDTAKDLRTMKELGIFLTASIIPGGWIGYGTYRITKYRLKKGDNDNTPAAAPQDNNDNAKKAAPKKFKRFRGPKV
ncbi:MAG: hypothetical protein PW788_02185 [Micavibrio sp.]|nr:hypothetical protein [Micavibrio sp.]